MSWPGCVPFPEGLERRVGRWKKPLSRWLLRPLANHIDCHTPASCMYAYMLAVAAAADGSRAGHDSVFSADRPAALLGGLPSEQNPSSHVTGRPGHVVPGPGRRSQLSRSPVLSGPAHIRLRPPSCPPPAARDSMDRPTPRQLLRMSPSRPSRPPALSPPYIASYCHILSPPWPGLPSSTFSSSTQKGPPHLSQSFSSVLAWLVVTGPTQLPVNYRIVLFYSCLNPPYHNISFYPAVCPAGCVYLTFVRDHPGAHVAALVSCTCYMDPDCAAVRSLCYNNTCARPVGGWRPNAASPVLSAGPYSVGGKPPAMPHLLSITAVPARSDVHPLLHWGGPSVARSELVM